MNYVNNDMVDPSSQKFHSEKKKGLTILLTILTPHCLIDSSFKGSAKALL